MTSKQVEETEEKESLGFIRVVSVSIKIATTSGAIQERILENDEAEKWSTEVQRRMTEYFLSTGETFPMFNWKWENKVDESKK